MYQNEFVKPIKRFFLTIICCLATDTAWADFASTLPLGTVAGYQVKYYDRELFHYLVNEIFTQKTYFFESPTDAPLILDCGNNIGMSILYFKSIYPKATIIGFEPGRKTFEILQENIKHNKLENVTLHNKALTNKEGFMNFYTFAPGEGRSSLFEERLDAIKRAGVKTYTEEVEGDLLSKYINQEIDFMKMDIEGAEFDVIEEIASKGKLRFIKQMIIEYHHHVKEQEDEFSKFLKILEDNGYGYQITANSKKVFPHGKPSRNHCQDILIYAYRKNV